MRLPAALALVALVLTSTAASADPEMPASKLADAAGCPSTMAFETTNGGDYAVAFDAPKMMTASFSIRAYGSTDDYSASLRNIAIATPYVRNDGASRFRSTALDLVRPEGSLIAAAAVIATLPSGKACPAELLYVPSVKAFLGRHRTQRQLDINGALAAEIGSGDTNTPFVREKPTSFSCASPFLQPTILTAQHPVIPDDAKSAVAGETDVLVNVAASSAITGTTIYESSGKPELDKAALEAARKSTYLAGVFGCVPKAGTTLFIAPFNLLAPPSPSPTVSPTVSPTASP